MLKTRHLIIALILWCSYGFVSAQEIDQRLSIKGYLDSYHATGVERQGQWMSSRTRLRTELKWRSDDLYAVASSNVIYNPITHESTYFDLREAYINYLSDHWEIKVGRQIITHGIADGLRITDVVSPMDLSEFLAQDYDDIRMPVNAIRLFYYTSSMRLEVMAVPTFEAFILPLDPHHPWGMMSEESMMIPIMQGQTPSKKIQNSDIGAYLSFTLPGIDFSFSALRTWNKMPIFSLVSTGSPQQPVALYPNYARQWVIGADFSKPIVSMVLRGEAAYIPDQLVDPADPKTAPSKTPTLNTLLGLDWYGPSTLMISGQLSMATILDKKGAIQSKQGQFSPLATLRIGKKFLEEQNLNLYSFGYFDLKHQGVFNRLGIEYMITDGFTVSMGYDLFSGKEGMFKHFAKNDEIWAKARYSF